MGEPLANQIGSHVPKMYRVALRLVGSSEAARDIVQDACLKALRRADDFVGRSAAATWLHRITVNCAYDHLRKKRRISDNPLRLDGDLSGMLIALEPSPSAHAEHKELYQIASAMIATLPDDCRTSFVLTQVDGYSYDEAAGIEDQPRGTIASRVHRARKILLEKLGGHFDGKALS